MKIKSLLAAAGLSLIGAMSASADQTVYSINVVGYMNVVCPPGFSMIGNQLTNSSGGNNISSITGVPDGTVIYKWVNGNFDIVQYYEVASGWSSDGSTLRTDMYLNPGEGAYIYNPGTSPFSLTFTGEVLQGALQNNLPPNFSIVSGMVPITGGLQGDHNLNGGANDVIYVWDPAINNFNIYQYYEGNGWSADGSTVTDPQINIGQGFWYFRDPANGGMNWTLNFAIP